MRGTPAAGLRPHGAPARTARGAEFRRPTREDGVGEDLARPSGDVAKRRTCLACGRPFESEGWHNRLCQPCRRLSDPVR